MRTLRSAHASNEAVDESTPKSSLWLVTLALVLAACAQAPPPSSVAPAEDLPTHRIQEIDLRRYGHPVDVAVGEGAVWVTARDGDEGWLVKVNPVAAEVADAVQMRGRLGANRVAAGHGSIWITTGGEGSGSLVRADPVTMNVRSAVPIAGGPQELDVGHDAVWVQTLLPLRRGQIVKVDPSTGRPAERIRLHREAVDIAVSANAVWVVAGCGSQGVVGQIDPSTNEVIEEISLRNPDCWNDIGAGRRAVWVASQVPEGTAVSALRIDPGTAEIVGEPIEVGAGAFSIGLGEDDLWVWTGIGNALSRVDAGTGEVTESLRIPGGAGGGDVAPGIAVGYGAVWFAGASALIRIGLRADR